jgi:hypothetical protein
MVNLFPSMSAMGKEQNETPLDLVAVPGLMTLIDVALYRTVEGQITATITSGHNLLSTWLDLKRQAIKVLNCLQKCSDSESNTHIQMTAISANTPRYISMESFARTCLDVACDAIQRMTTDRFAETANLSSSDASSIYESNDFSKDMKGAMKNDDPGKIGSNSAMIATMIESANDTGRRGSPLEPQQGKDCWESQRLFCPDYVWADDVAHHAQRLVRLLFKNHFVANSLDTSSSNRETDEDTPPFAKSSNYNHFSNTCVEQEASVLLLVVTRDLPSRLVQFRASIEADAVTIKRLYLVKSEYRAPFRAFLESHQSLQRAPSLELVNEFTQMPKSRIEQKRTSCKEHLQKLLTKDYLVEALALEQKCEEYEIAMANALYGFSELARYLIVKRSSIYLDDDVSSDAPLLLDTLRRLKSILCRKVGPDSSTGIRPILLDLQGIPRDEERHHPPARSYFVTELEIDRRLDIFIQQLRTLRELCCDSKRHAFYRSDKKVELDVPSWIARGCDEFDHELFRCHFEDWMAMVQRQHELTRENDFEELAESIRQAEIQMSLATATNQSLDVVRLRLEAIESDREKRWIVLKEILEDVCLREINLHVQVLKPNKDKILALQATSALGIFGFALQMAGEALPLG